METIDLKKTKTEQTFEVDRSSTYILNPTLLKNISIKNTYTFEFNNSDISSKIIYRCIAEKGTTLDLKIILTSKEKNIKNVEVFLEIYILNLSENNNIIIRPFLEIPHKDIKFEHKVTIGAPNEKWINYLKSRGLSYKEGLKLISDAFITGQ